MTFVAYNDLTMLLSLESKRQGHGSEDAIGLLVACHTRIRSFTQTALRLSQAGRAPVNEIADAAAAVHRYFTVALPLHVQDEDISLAERLAPVATEAVLEDLVLLAGQHREIEALVDELVPQWHALMNEPRRLAKMAPSLQEDTMRLDELFQEHLALEEQRVFPASKTLMTIPEQLALAKDIRDRRARSMEESTAQGRR